MKKQDILNARLLRHCLVTPLTDEATYWDLFRQLQPVSTIHNTYPGAPPSLVPFVPDHRVSSHSDLRKKSCKYWSYGPFFEGEKKSIRLEIIQTLHGWTTGYAVPHFMIDAPGGGGKIAVHPDPISGRDEDDILLKNFRGETYRYTDVAG